MSLIQWDETMAVGSEELDDQHKTLIGLINEAYEAIQKHDEQMVITLIDQMREYAVIHFHTEEEYMEKHGYPDLAAHQELHDQFNDQVDEFQQSLFQKTNFSQIFIFLSRWLTTHIMSEDKKFSKYLPKESGEE